MASAITFDFVFQGALAINGRKITAIGINGFEVDSVCQGQLRLRQGERCVDRITLSEAEAQYLPIVAVMQKDRSSDSYVCGVKLFKQGQELLRPYTGLQTGHSYIVTVYCTKDGRFGAAIDARNSVDEAHWMMLRMALAVIQEPIEEKEK